LTAVPQKAFLHFLTTMHSTLLHIFGLSHRPAPYSLPNYFAVSLGGSGVSSVLGEHGSIAGCGVRPDAQVCVGAETG
jgi:hypothetical protein